MNPWQRERRRRNVVVFLFLTSLLIFFLLVVNRIVGLVPYETVGQAATAAPVPDEKPADLRGAKKTPKRTRIGALAQTEETQPDAPLTLEQPKDVQPPAAASSLKLNVKSEPTLVYSSNSPRSSVVEALKKGDQVETNLEVIDSHGRWSLVRAKGQSQSGFVRTEDLERPQTEQK